MPVPPDDPPPVRHHPHGPVVPTAPRHTGRHYTGNPGTGSGSSGGDPAATAASQFDWSKNHTLALEAKAQRTADAADRVSLQNILSQAGLVKQQIAALKIQLSDKGFRQALETHLSNALQAYRQGDKVLMHGFRDKSNQLAGSAADNEKSAGDQAFANLSNASRERLNAISNSAQQGAGETDTLRSQQMSLRNWDANQSDVNRSYFDTLRSINSAQTDLNTDTRTARVNANQALQDRRASLWDQFYSQRADAWDKIANLYGSRGQLLGQAAGVVANPESGSYDRNSPYGRERDRADRLAARALRQSSLQTGKAYDEPGVPKRLLNWDGRDTYQELGPSQGMIRANSAGYAAPKPEGANLRTWTA
jgi:hypothetical protein